MKTGYRYLSDQIRFDLKQKKDFNSTDGIRICPAITFLKELI